MIIGGVGSPLAYSLASGGKFYVYNALTTIVTVAPANPSRQRLVFHNPSTKDILIAPATAYATLTASLPTTFTPTTSNKGGCFLLFANGGTLEITGECQGAWQALSADGATAQLSVMDSNIRT